MGAIAGWLARKVIGTSRRQGLIVIGIVGVVIGGLLSNTIGASGVLGTQ